MPADFSELDSAVSALTDQVTATEGTEASAIALINGFAVQVTVAVTAALEADNAADAISIQAAKDAIATVTARFNASAAALGAAVAIVPTP